MDHHPVPASRPLAAAIVLALFAAPVVPAHAAPAPKELDTVEVVGAKPRTSAATRTRTRALDVPQAVSSVGEQEIAERNATSLNEALQTVAGVSPALGEGRRDQFNIRGFSALTDQYLDGLRDDGQYYRDLANTERLEVLKGPASVLYGRGSGGGIVNRVSKTPDLDAPIRRASLGAGSYEYLRGTVDIGDHAQGNDFAWRVNVAAENSGSFRAHGFNERYLAAPALRWRVGAGELTAQAELLHDRRVPDRGIPGLAGRPAPVDLDTYYGDPARDVFTTDAGEARLAYEGPLGDWTLRNTVVFGRVETDFYNTFANSVVESTQRVKRGQYDSTTDSDNVFDQLEATGTIGGDVVRHTLLGGIELGRQARGTLRHTGSAPDVDLFDPDLTVGSTPSAVLATDNDFTGRTLAAYLQDQVDLGTHWKALLGVRWDRYAQRLDNHLGAGSTLERLDTALSPRAGLVYKPVADHSLYAGWSRSFQPSGDGLSLATNTAELEPERAALRELGWKAQWFGGRIESTLAVFDQRRDNLRTTNPLDPSQLVQVGEQRTRGVEVEFDGRVGERLDLRFAYARLDAEIINPLDPHLDGHRPANVPEDSASLWGLFDVGGGFSVGLGAVAVGERYSANDDLVRLPGYVRTDALVRWRGDVHELALNLKNLGDIAYYESAHTTHQIMPGAPRSAMLTWRVDY
jgi:catecholate siderophore receptor